MIKVIPTLFLALFILPLTASAETMYVSDTLRVGIRAEPGNNEPSIAVVQSGVAVEVINRKGSYIQVRTASGVEGWVKSAYFSNNAPAAKKLDDAMLKISSLEKEIDSLNKEMKKEAETVQPDLSNKVSSLEMTNKKLTEEIRSLKSSPDTGIINTLSITNLSENMLYVALGTLVVLFSLGFLFGVSWHKSQVTKRLGGMSI